MPRIAYEDKNLHGSTMAIVAAAIDICEEYDAQGYDLTLRQLYYQFVARGLMANKQKNYDRLGRAVSSGRMAGLIDWDHITDRTRNLMGINTLPDAATALRMAGHKYQRDHWSGQPLRVEVWVEKEALSGVVSQAANRWQADWLACRGYMSQSEMWEAGRRFLDYLREDDVERVVVLHLGDHDPSGIDMTRDIADRLFTFMGHNIQNEGLGSYFEEVVEVRRIALNMDQVEQYDPPPNPAKLTDSRASDYISLYGRQSWELDALDPATLVDLVAEHITDELDWELWQQQVDTETAERERIFDVARRMEREDDED